MKMGLKNDQSDWYWSDYTWLPPWGLLTAKTIKKLYDNNNTSFTMKDNSVIYLCKAVKLSKMIQEGKLKWIIENPGIILIILIIKNYRCSIVYWIISSFI